MPAALPFHVLPDKCTRILLITLLLKIKTDYPHFHLPLRTNKKVKFPDFPDALGPQQRWNMSLPAGSYINYQPVFSTSPVHYFIRPVISPVPPHAVLIPAVIAQQLKMMVRFIEWAVARAKTPKRGYKSILAGFFPTNRMKKRSSLLLKGFCPLDGETPFLKDFLPFQQEVAWFGMLNSLSQVFSNWFLQVYPKYIKAMKHGDSV